VYSAVGASGVWNIPCSFKYASVRAICPSERPERRMKLRVSWSTGKMPQVAPYSGAMLAMVARSARERCWRPGPVNSTNFPTTPWARSISVTCSTRSVAVAPSGISPESRTPTTWGISMETGCPSMAASASMPPTPHPRTPSPLIMVVWESVPTSVSGKA